MATDTCGAADHAVGEGGDHCDSRAFKVARTEATEALRGLVDAIVLTPGLDGETLQIELRGNLAAMLGATVQNATRSPETGDLESQIAMVALFRENIAVGRQNLIANPAG